MHEPRDLTTSLERLRCGADFSSATSLLREASQSQDPSRCLKQILRALVAIERMPSPLQRLTWLVTMASPRCLRIDHSRTIGDLWEGGICRSLDGLALSSGAVRLLRAVAHAPDEMGPDLLSRLDACHAFNELIPSRQPPAITAEAVQFAFSGSASEADRVLTAATRAGVESVIEVAQIAGWLHALTDPDAADVITPDSHATRYCLTAPALRGLRRRGARAHGRQLGLKVAKVASKRSAPAQAPTTIPGCLTPSDAIVDVMSPLLIDFLSSAIAQLAPQRNIRDRAHQFASACPAVCDAVASWVEPRDHWDFESRVAWLERMLGLATALPTEPADRLVDSIATIGMELDT